MKISTRILCSVLFFSNFAFGAIPLNSFANYENFFEDSITGSFLICYFRDKVTGEKSWEWAKDPRTQDFVRLYGTWTNSSASALLKMNLSFDENKELFRKDCLSTNEASGRASSRSYVEYGVADNLFSYNHQVWYEKNSKNQYGLPFSKFIVFGDSLSDNGNLLNYSRQFYPNGGYFMGRFSNGPVWTDYLAKQLNLDMYNWALGGATAIVPFPLPYTVENEIDHYIETMKKVDHPNYENSLFAFFIGANNYSFNVDPVPEKIVQSTEAQIRMLIALGGKYFILPNLPEIALTPSHSQESPQRQEELRNKIHQHNLLLASMIQRLKSDYPFAVFIAPDIFNFLNEIIQNKDKYNLKNVSEKCFQGTGIGKVHLENICPNPNEYVFWDFIHPTTQIHCAMVQNLMVQMKEAFLLNLPQLTYDECLQAK